MRVGAWQIESAADVPAAGTWTVAVGPVAGRARAAGSRAPRAASERAWVSVLPPDADRIGRAGQRAAHDALARLDDPRIPVALGYFEGSGAYVVGASEGWPLTLVVEGRRDRVLALSPATLLDLVIDLCEAVGHAHQRRLVHGRLWPGCVWVARDGHLVVWGFGAPVAAPAAWAIPDRALDEATDQWSIGALAVALVTGRPFDGTAAIDAQWPALGRVLRRMTEPVKADRFESLDAARHALIGLARRAGEASDRRALVAWLSGEPIEAEPVEQPEEVVAEVSEPSEEADQSDPTEVPVPRVDRPARIEPRVVRAPLPEEPLPVVRPSVDDEVPVAALRPAASRTPDGAGMTFGRPTRAGRGEVAAPALAALSSDVDGAAPTSPPRDPAVSPTAPDGPPAPPPLEPPMPPRPLSLPIDDAPVGPPAVEIEFDDTDEFAFDPPSGNGVERAQPTAPVVARVARPDAIPVHVELDDDDGDDGAMAPRHSGPALGDFGAAARASAGAVAGPSPVVAPSDAIDDGLAFGSTQQKPEQTPFQVGRVAVGLVVVMLVMMVVWFVVRGVG
jgi:hypothetical protein